MIPVQFCPDCRATDVTCPSCGEPVRALKTALIATPACRGCQAKTAVYYDAGRSVNGSDANYWLRCPSREQPVRFLDSWVEHELKLIIVPTSLLVQRIAIRLRNDAELHDKEDSF